jgi:hypothetical protein
MPQHRDETAHLVYEALDQTKKSRNQLDESLRFFLALETAVSRLECENVGPLKAITVVECAFTGTNNTVAGEVTRLNRNTLRRRAHFAEVCALCRGVRTLRRRAASDEKAWLQAAGHD